MVQSHAGPLVTFCFVRDVNDINAPVAQRPERLRHMEEVTGSNPVWRIGGRCAPNDGAKDEGRTTKDTRRC